MTPSAIIDSALTSFEGLDATDGGNARARAQLLVLLQMVQDELEDRPGGLQYLYTVATLTINANANSVAFPTNYRDMGPEGSLWIPSLNRPLNGPLHQQQIVEARLANGDQADEIWDFGVWDSKFQTVKAASATVMSLYYLKLSPTLTDADTAQLLMPAQYHNWVVLPGVLSRCNRIKDELRDTMGEVYTTNKAQFWVRERPRRAALDRMPQQEGTLT